MCADCRNALKVGVSACAGETPANQVRVGRLRWCLRVCGGNPAAGLAHTANPLPGSTSEALNVSFAVYTASAGNWC